MSAEPTEEQLVAFKKAWHEADAEGRDGHRVEQGLRAVLNLVGPDQIAGNGRVLHEDDEYIILRRGDVERLAQAVWSSIKPILREGLKVAHTMGLIKEEGL